jgi:hypothetical protein
MGIFLSIHYTAVLRGDGLLPELVAVMERPIPKVAEPVDVLSDSEAPLEQNNLNRPARRP